MTTQFQIATTNDLEMLVELMREYYEYDQHPFDEDKVRRVLADFLKDHTWGYAWIIRANESVIGYMVICFGYSLEFGGRDAFLDEIYLREAYRGLGIGGAALGHLLDACRSDGIGALHLEVMPDNRKVMRFYERNGFENRGSTLMSRYVD